MRDKLKEGDKLSGYHCQGYDVEILYTVEFANNEWSATGRCHNPQCRAVCGCGNRGCHYDGIISIESQEWAAREVANPR